MKERNPNKPDNKKPERYKQTFSKMIADIVLYYMETDDKLLGKIKGAFTKKGVKWMYQKIPKKYDKDAFVFDDKRLNVIKETATNHFVKNWDKNDRNFLIQCLYICLFIMKEDVYYRPRWILMLQDINKNLNSLKINNKYIELFKDISNKSLDMELESREIELMKIWGGLNG